MPPVISNLVFTKTASTIVATWDTDISSDSNLTAGGKAAIDNGVAAATITGHQCIVTGLLPSTLYSCIVTSGGTSSTPQNITTNAQPARTPILSCSFGSSTTTAPDGDIPYNFLSSDNNTYMTRDDATTPGTGANQQLCRITNEATLAITQVNALTNYGGFSTNNGTDGPGGSSLSNKANGLFGMAGRLFIFCGRHSIVGGMRQQFYGNVIADNADHGATWNNFTTPGSFAAAGTPVFPNSGGNSVAPFFFGGNSNWGWVSPVRYAGDDATLGYNTSGNGFDGGNAYVYCVIIEQGNDSSDYAYLMRTPRIQLAALNRTAQEFWAGPTNPTPADFVNDTYWTTLTSGLTKILQNTGKIGWPDMTFVPTINRYLFFCEYRPNLAVTSNTVWLVYEAPTPAGPFTQIGAQTNTPSGWYNMCVLHRTASSNVATNSIALTVVYSGDYNNKVPYYHITYSTLTLQTTGGGGGVATFVQEAHTTAAQSGTTGTLAYSGNVTSGNLLTCAWRYNGAGAPHLTSLTDTRGNTWNIVYDQNDAGGTPIQGGWAYAFANGTGANTVTLNFNTSVTGIDIIVQEHNGPTSLRVASAAAVGTTGTPPASPAVAATASDLQLGFTTLGAASLGTLTATGGYTLRSTSTSGGTPFVGGADILSSAGGSVTASFNYTVGGTKWSCGIGVFIVGAGSTFSISGNAGVTGATVSYSGTSSGSVTADGGGNYNIPGLANGPYTLTPSKASYTFSPVSSNQTVSGADITGVNFVATFGGGTGPVHPSLSAGTPAKLNGGVLLTAPGDLQFSISKQRGSVSVTFQAVGTVTALTSSLQVSLDSITWSDYVVAGSFISNGTPSVTIRPLIAGAQYRVHATAVTGSMDIWACAE